MRAVIVSGGNMENPELIKEYLTESSLLIACDKGINYTCAAGLTPDIILGDFDSADKEVLAFYRAKGTEIRTYPARKDSTDTEIGIAAAVKEGAKDIILLSASGTRLDHTVANIQILMPLLEKGVRARLIDSHNIVELVKDRLVINNMKGNYISLLPLTPRVEGVTSSGLDYPLDNMDITMGTSLTVSNFIASNKAEVRVKSGILISIIAND